MGGREKKGGPVIATYDADNGKYVGKERWVIDTAGTNLMDLLAIDMIDSSRTMTIIYLLNYFNFCLHIVNVSCS